ncbi:MAG: hypothetical protein ACI9J5_000823 [Paraglaciecola sp.]|jgi:hypothetical protein
MRRWDRIDKLKPHSRTLGDDRRYKRHELGQIKVGSARAFKRDLSVELEPGDAIYILSPGGITSTH